MISNDTRRFQLGNRYNITNILYPNKLYSKFTPAKPNCNQNNPNNHGILKSKMSKIVLTIQTDAHTLKEKINSMKKIGADNRRFQFFTCIANKEIDTSHFL